MSALITTLPIPQRLLDSWQLPPGWDEHVCLHVANSDFVQGSGESVLALLKDKSWVFSVSVHWVPMEYRKSETHFCEVSLEDFRTLLIQNVLDFDSEFPNPWEVAE